MVFAIEPFLSTGSREVAGGNDEWTLFAAGGGPPVQYEHTVVASRHGPLVLTLA